ncbi:cysteine desulfurase [Acidiferrimicrobium sp. IK]|uniref:cysteine desulfurase family protein n=1 Tax=Acidiferrimicrobium sp. IK TaxID=2871700 RepID=UPI0021CB799B|nr:cysteine desulfurase family protein [Acidiferrimicrobium sp. IK]MCU4185843.1 cysteine desulfurase [Acidiferrimicrobium sp. IK]
MTAGRAYLDHASTSMLRPAALDAMVPWLSAADPGRVHTEGRMARAALEDAREQVASLLGTRPRQVVFTSGATESINAAVHGALARAGDGRSEVVGPAVEHSAVREASERRAATVTWTPVDRTGRVEVGALLDAIGPATALVHCQLANHEVGTLQPVAEVVAACRERGVLVHVDAATAAGHVPVGFDDLGADLLSVAAHKLGGPRGAGAMLVRRGLRIPPLLVGGAQERDRRAGLEDVAAMVGFGAAAAELLRTGPGAEPTGLDAEAARAAGQIQRLRAAATAIPGVEAFGPDDPAERVPHILCLGVDGVEAEAVLLGLDQAGVAAHSGSACSSETLEPSPVLEAMGVAAERSLRLSVGWSTTDADIDRAAGALGAVISRLRDLRRP